MCCTRLAANAGSKKVAKNRHLGTIPQLCRAISSQLRHVSTIGKKFVKHQYLPHMSPQYGELWPIAAEIDPVVWGTPANFNGFRVLAALLHDTRVLGISHTLRRWTEGATCIWQGGHHVGHWPTFQSIWCNIIKCFFNNWSQSIKISFKLDNHIKVILDTTTSAHWIPLYQNESLYFYREITHLAMHVFFKTGIVTLTCRL